MSTSPTIFESTASEENIAKAMDVDEQPTEQKEKLNSPKHTDDEVHQSATEETEKEEDKEKETPSGKENETSAVAAPVNKTTFDSKSKQNLKLNLRVVISNMYMNTEKRLPSARVPKCLHNTSGCVSMHRSAMLPDAPSFGRAQDLRQCLYNEHYDTFIDILQTMVLQSVFPGEQTFDRLFEIIMVLKGKRSNKAERRETYINVLHNYYLLVDAFPPCWTALRPYYLDFLGVSNENERNPKKPQKLKLLLDLLDECLIEATGTELTELTADIKNFDSSGEDENNVSMSEEHILMQDYDWRTSKEWIDDFRKMDIGIRLQRIFDGLDMICWVLERQFLSWLDHNRLEQAEPEIFQDEAKPFVLIVFGMTADTRCSPIALQLLRLYGRAAAKSLHSVRMSILERFVSLIMEASNTAELEYKESSLIYPNVGPQTTLLIWEFFKIFKAENPTHISTYINIIPQLKQNYVRFEFANHFLKLFYFSKAPFGPEKICEEFRTKQWLKYKPRSAIVEGEEDEQLSREDYLKIMLNGLQDFCSWLNLKPFWKFIKTKVPVKPLQTRTTSPLATPVGVVTGEVCKIFMLDEMQKEAHTWKHRINKKTLITKPKVNLPTVRISTIKMAEIYGNNIRLLRYMRRVLLEVNRYVDMTDWLAYLDDFLGKDEPSA